MTTFNPQADPGSGRYRSSARPVFVVGAPRSGVSLLTLSLGQHPNLEQVMETNWFARFAIGLQQTYSAGIAPRETSQLDASGFDAADFTAYLGDAIDRFMLDQTGSDHDTATSSTRRWLDGSHDLAHELFPLLRLFPHAKIIHVYREVGEVVGTLTNPENKPLYKRRYRELPSAEATAEWMRAITACVDAERAFGSATVYRVRRRDLVQQPESVLRRCFEFIGEPFDPACLRAFRPLDRTLEVSSTEPALAVHQERVRVSDTAELLSKMLMEEGTPSYPSDEHRIEELEIAFGDRVERETRTITQGGKPKGTQSKRSTNNGNQRPGTGKSNADSSLFRSMKRAVAKLRSSSSDSL